MSPPENLKRKVLTQDADGDGRTDRGNTLCPFHHSSNSLAQKKTALKRTFLKIHTRWITSQFYSTPLFMDIFFDSHFAQK